MSEISSEELKALYSEGVDCFNEGNYVKAEGLLNEVIRHNPNLADIHNKLGVIANLEGNLEVAATHFKDAVKLNPNYTEASLNLAITLNELGRGDEAQGVFSNISASIDSKGSGLDPFAAGKIANEHYKLGNLYLEFNMAEEAVLEYQKALKLRPMPDVMTKLGVALRGKGDFEGAARELELARETNPNYAYGLVQLGLTYYLMKRHQDAFALWEEVLVKAPDHKEAASFLKMFRKEG